jgi:hypothetical protein
VSGSGKSSRDFDPTIGIPQAGQSLGYWRRRWRLFGHGPADLRIDLHQFLENGNEAASCGSGRKRPQPVIQPGWGIKVNARIWKVIIGF